MRGSIFFSDQTAWSHSASLTVLQQRSVSFALTRRKWNAWRGHSRKTKPMRVRGVARLCRSPRFKSWRVLRIAFTLDPMPRRIVKIGRNTLRRKEAAVHSWDPCVIESPSFTRTNGPQAEDDLRRPRRAVRFQGLLRQGESHLGELLSRNECPRRLRTARGNRRRTRCAP